MKVVAVILTFNEEQHLGRCIQSLQGVVDQVVVVDCYSTDATIQIASAAGAKVLQNRWKNYATQFNWGLEQLDSDTNWVLRIDADEYLTAELASEIKSRLAQLPPAVAGVYLPRHMVFQGKIIRYGGIFPVKVLRLFRYGFGSCEQRWMDEHIKVNGSSIEFSGELIDHNLNSLSWWTEKHNGYASREVIDLLNLQYQFMVLESVADPFGGTQVGVKRWIKESMYTRLPGGFRALVYFLYRYVLRLGFLDGRAGANFHVLQGFWYRFLVDSKLAEVKRYMVEHSVGVEVAIEKVLRIKV